MLNNSICVIDDDPICVFGIKKILQKTHFFDHFSNYDNGLEALNNFVTILNKGEKLPRIILLDLNMPIMDGWSFLEHFKKIPLTERKNTFIYIVSSSVDPLDHKRAEKFEEVYSFFVKPLSPDKVQELMNQLS